MSPTSRFTLALAGVAAVVLVSGAVAVRPVGVIRVAPESIAGAGAALATRIGTVGAVRPGVSTPPRVGDAGAPSFSVGPKDGPVPDGVRVRPGESLGDAVGAAKPGTTVIVTAGVHRGDIDIRVPNDVTIVGEPGAVLNGSRLLEGFIRRGSQWELDGQPNKIVSYPSARCDRSSPMCGYPEDVYVDDVPLHRVETSSSVGPGRWSYDYSRGVIVLGGDPAGHTVEISQPDTHAFIADYGVGGENVVIRNLTIEKYGMAPQDCAIKAQDSGGTWQKVDDPANGSSGGWLIQDDDIRLNHGCAVQAGPGNRVLNNLLRDNGQTGIKAVGRHIEIRQNEISGNNYAGFDESWEAGGSKFWSAADLVFAENWSHDNLGSGVWSDYSLHNIVYDHNTFTGNKGEGIAQEMTLSGRATYNFLAGNDWFDRGDAASVAGAIFIFDSADFEVAHNVLRGNNGGVIVQSQQRGCIGSQVTQGQGQGQDGCAPGSELAGVQGVSVHDNDMSMTDGYSGLVVLLHADSPPYAYAPLEWVRQQYLGGLVHFDQNTYRGTGFENIIGKDSKFGDMSRRFLWGFPYGMASDPNDPWNWVDRRYLGFGDWQRITGQDLQSTYVAG